MPAPLISSLELIEDFIKQGVNNKLCLVFPAKEFSAQWLSIPLLLFQIKEEFINNYSEIFEAYKIYRPSQKLFLNNKAIVEWVEGDADHFTFRTKGKASKNNPWSSTNGDKITIAANRINNLKPAPSNRTLSSAKLVYDNLKPKSTHPLDKLLSINSNGNLLFQKQTVCIITKYKDFENSVAQVLLNQSEVSEYFEYAKIDENGHAEKAPLLISNNVFNLYSHLSQGNKVELIIIDGYSNISDKGITDFADLEALQLRIPTLLVTDLSEMDAFEDIRNGGFDFFNFTRDKLNYVEISHNSPFVQYESKLNRYTIFKLNRELCLNEDLENVIKNLNSIERDESNRDLLNIKIPLIGIANLISRIAWIPNTLEISSLKEKLSSVESQFLKSRIWLGEASRLIEVVIATLKILIDRLSLEITEKCLRLQELLRLNGLDYILCATEEDCKSLKAYVSTLKLGRMPIVSSILDIHEQPLSESPKTAILISWPKSSGMNRLLTSFFFSEISVLFYQFEMRYCISILRRNRNLRGIAKSTVDQHGQTFKAGELDEKWFEDAFDSDAGDRDIQNPSFDVVAFEQKLDNAQFQSFIAKDDSTESLRAKRVDFENDKFIYATESHSFLVINDLLQESLRKSNIRKEKIESLKPGDIISFINTDRGILVDLVERHVNPQDLSKVKYWTDLWKKLLLSHYISCNRNFKRLIAELRVQGCKKDEVTIKTWLFDSNRIGPRDDDDLRSIAVMSRSKELLENITTVRSAITQMKGWRHDASDFVIKRIKVEIRDYASSLVINSIMQIEELGTVDILKVKDVNSQWQQIDSRYVNRLLSREI